MDYRYEKTSDKYFLDGVICINTVFDKKQTNIVKGIAICLLLWHHLFYNTPERYDDFVSVYILPDGVPLECFISFFCKICVSVFLFLSGYGLYRSWRSYQRRSAVNGKLTIGNQIVFIKNHLLKLMFEYWFIFIVFVPIGFILGKFSCTPWYNLIYYLPDFFGLSSLLNSSTFNLTWWFMSIIIVYYLLLPLLIKIIDYCPELLIILTLCSMLFFQFILLSFPPTVKYLLPFVTGVYFAHYNILEKSNTLLNTTVKKALVLFLSLVIFFTLRSKFSLPDYLDIITGVVPIILISYMFASKIKLLNKTLEELGICSGKIFMFHTFINSYYFHDFIYSLKYPLVIFLFMVVLCYLTAKLLEWIKNITRYNKLLQFLTKEKQPKVL